MKAPKSVMRRTDRYVAPDLGSVRPLMMSIALLHRDAVRGRDVDGAVVLDVDRDARLVDDALDGLAARPMMMRIWSGLTLSVVMRGAYCEIRTRLRGPVHLAEDVEAAFAACGGAPA